jgi:hypothetical protein
MAADRPILISIVSILNIVLGLLAIIAGIVIIADIAGFTTELVNQLWEKIQEQGQSVDFTKDDLLNVMKIFGGMFSVAGIINALIGVGMWLGWRIMWYIGLVVNILELVFGIGTLIFGNFSAIISIIINGLIIYYLFRPGVKAFFNV